MALYNNKGSLIAKYEMPTTSIGGVKGDGYGYGIAINPAKNVLLTSSFSGWQNYMRELGDLIKDPEDDEALWQYGWWWNLKSMQPTQILSVTGAPLEIRWSLAPGQNWAITAAALTSKLWLIKQGEGGTWAATEVGTIGNPAQIPLPVDISITADGKGLWVNTFMDGTTHYFDITDPEHPRESYQKHTGSQVNMISQSWDGKRPVHHVEPAGALGQEGRGQRAVPARLQLGRPCANPRFRSGFHQGQAGAPASHEIHRESWPVARARSACPAVEGHAPVLEVLRGGVPAHFRECAGSRRREPSDGAPEWSSLRCCRAHIVYRRFSPSRTRRYLTNAVAAVRLSALTRGKITLLTFFYTYCVDPLGCPFAHQTLTMLRDRILRDRELARGVRFVGISCDPSNDTPEVLARYAMDFTTKLTIRVAVCHGAVGVSAAAGCSMTSARI